MLKLSNRAIIALMVLPYFNMKHKKQFLFKINRFKILPKFLPKIPSHSSPKFLPRRNSSPFLPKGGGKGGGWKLWAQVRVIPYIFERSCHPPTWILLKLILYLHPIQTKKNVKLQVTTPSFWIIAKKSPGIKYPNIV